MTSRVITFIIIFCTILILILGNKSINQEIYAQVVLDETVYLQEIFPEATKFDKGMLDNKEYYIAKKDDKELGYIISVEAEVYDHIAKVLVGFDSKAEIKAMKILSKEETAGLGAKMVETLPGESKPWFLKQFEGKNASDLEDAQAVTGATVSSRAIIDGVKKEVVDFVSKLK